MIEGLFRGNTAHYLLHGYHHKHPMDGLRLIFPPTDCYSMHSMLLCSTPTTAPAIFGGGFLGYVMYECMHYYLHHGQPSRYLGRHLKRYHLNHHFKIQTSGFGITSSLWDHIFRTFPQ